MYFFAKDNIKFWKTQDVAALSQKYLFSFQHNSTIDVTENFRRI